MDATVPAKPAVPRRPFPYASWGPTTALLGVLLALAAGLLLATPAAVIGHQDNGELTDVANAFVQLATELGFLLVPIAIAAGRGASLRGALSQLGLRPFRASALKWMLAAVGAYLLFSFVYVALFGPPEQEDIAESLGAVPLQVALIVLGAPVCEETLFRGFLFGGLRERLPRIAAAAVSGLVFGGLHAFGGLSVVPPLVFFGFVLALLYERTGSIVPGIVLHMLNNSVALLGQ